MSANRMPGHGINLCMQTYTKIPRIAPVTLRFLYRSLSHRHLKHACKNRPMHTEATRQSQNRQTHSSLFDYTSTK